MIDKKVIEVSSAVLKRFIYNYWVIDFSGIPQEIELKVPPVGFPVMHIHFGDSGNFYNHKNFTSESLIIGQLSRHVLLRAVPGIKFLGVNFKPYSLYNIYGISPLLFKDSGVESSLIFKKESVIHISDSLKRNGVAESIALVEKLLLESIIENDKVYLSLDRMVDKIVDENGLISFDEINDIKISYRSVQRYFSEVIGIPYKRFCQILRHKYILEEMYKNPKIKWSDMVMNGFYYDFSHFSKDFIDFSGLTPSQYLPVKNLFATALLKK